MTIRFRLTAALPLVLAMTLGAGCTKTKAKVTPEMPGLDVPPPPPRVVEPTEADTPPPVPLVKEPARHQPPQPTRQNHPAAEAAKPEPPKPEPPKPEVPSEAPKAEEPPKAPPAPSTLQTTPTQAEGQVERDIRALLGRAQSDLARVDYRNLNTDARTQYDQAKRFVQQAEEALRAKNLVFARNLADKAAAIAAQLAGR